MVGCCCCFSGWDWEWEAETERGGGLKVVFVDGVDGKKDVRGVDVTEGEMPGLIKGLEEPVDGGPRYIWFTRGAGAGISE